MHLSLWGNGEGGRREGHFGPVCRRLGFRDTAAPRYLRSCDEVSLTIRADKPWKRLLSGNCLTGSYRVFHMPLYGGCKLGKPEYPYLSYGSSSKRVRPSEASTCKREKLAPPHRQDS